MSFPVIEIATLPISEKLRADHSLIHPTADTLLAQPGCKKVSWGVLMEDENTALVFVEWEKLDDHINFTKQPYYKPFIEELSKLLTGPVDVIHAPVKPFPPGKALDGPVVEYTLFHPNSEPNAKEELSKVTQEILDLAEQHPKCFGYAIGPAVEDPDELVILLSWPTLEAHMVEYREQPAFKPLGERLVKVASKTYIVHLDIIHYKA